MDDLLPFYEKELTFLRRHAREFAERYPKVATRLLISGEACEDPHVERLLQSFALLSARISKKIEDDFPEITESLLEVLYPHYLRPFPSCSIVRFDAGGADAQLSGPVRLPRGTPLTARPTRGTACKFRTAYAVTLSPLAISSASFDDAVSASKGLRSSTEASHVLSLGFETRSPQLPLDALAQDRVRVFLDGDNSLISQLREALFARSLGFALETDPSRPWTSVNGAVISPVGFADDEALLDYDARSQPAYRLLSEYFAFPDKFNFIDIDFSALRALLPTGCRRFSLKCLLKSPRGGAEDARLLERLSVQNFLLGCTPVVNLFTQNAEPVRLNRTRSAYPVVADSRRAYATEIYRINAVRKVEKSVQGEVIVDYHPMFSLRHAESLEERGRFWHLKRNEEVARLSPGHEYEIAIIDFDFNPLDDKAETLSIELSCTNRDLPSQLPYGLPGGDLFVEGGSVAKEIRLLRRPTPTYRFSRGQGAQWRLISHLALNHLSLTTAGAEALRETLLLYDLPRSPANRRQVEGLVGISHRATTEMMAGNPFQVFVRGLEIELVLDEHSYVGIGISLFASVLERFLSLYVHSNSFIRLVVRSSQTGEEILRCQPRNGDVLLA